MSESPPPERGLFASLRQLLSTALEVAHVRLALLGNEIEQEKLRIIDAVLCLGLALIFLGVGLLLVSALIVMLLWEGYRILALSVLTVLFLVGGVWLLVVGRQRLESPGGMFQTSLSEIARDQAGLGAPE